MSIKEEPRKILSIKEAEAVAVAVAEAVAEAVAVAITNQKKAHNGKIFLRINKEI